MSGPRSSLRGRNRWALVALCLSAAVYLALAAAIALDRAAPARPALAQWVPERFQLNTLAVGAQQLVQGGEARRARAMAELLVRRDPLSPAATGLLGTARLDGGQARSADAAFRTAAKLGWRDALTQIYWLETALGEEDFGRAALRFGAVAQQWPNAPAIDQLSAQFESDPRGQAALAQRIGQGASWAQAYARPVINQSIDRLAGRATVLIAAAGQGNKLGCKGVAEMVTNLAEARPSLANALWASHCAHAPSPGTLSDGGFERFAAITAPSVFDWQLPGHGALESAVVRNTRGGHVLEARSTASTMLPIAAQRIVLRPGEYRITWQDLAAAPASPARIAASLSCRPDRTLAAPQRGLPTASGYAVSLRYRGGCEGPLLQLWLVPGTGAVALDTVVLAPR